METLVRHGGHVLDADDVTFSMPPPMGQGTTAKDKVLQAGTLRDQMFRLRMDARMQAGSEAELIERAFRNSHQELAALTRVRHSEPLLPALQADLLRHLDLSTPRNVRCVTWLVVAPLFTWRTHEGLLTMHTDLEMPTEEQLGGWRVPGFTKTTDGSEGFVARWNHRCGCCNEKLSLTEILALSLDLLNAAACGVDASGRLSLELACPMCLVFLSRKLQGLGDNLSDGLSPLFQQVDGNGNFNGRIVVPEYLLEDVRSAMRRLNTEREDAGLQLYEIEAYTLYMARHGGIMALLMQGRTVEWVAEHVARISPETLYKHYRRHLIRDDPFEANGRFGQHAMLRSVVASAASEGFLCSASDIEALLRRMALSPELLQQIPRIQLLERLASIVIEEPTLTAACGALLRSHLLRSALVERCSSGTQLAIAGEDVELEPSQLLEAVRAANVQKHARGAANLEAALLAPAQLQATTTSSPLLEGPAAPHEVVPLSACASTSLLQVELAKILTELMERNIQKSALPRSDAIEAFQSGVMPSTVLVNLPQVGWQVAEIVSCSLESNAAMLQLHSLAPQRIEEHTLEPRFYEHAGCRGWLFLQSPLVEVPQHVRCDGCVGRDRCSQPSTA